MEVNAEKNKIVGSTWKAKMKPKEFTFSINSPKRNNDPSLVNPKTVTKTALSHSKQLCIKGTFNMATANINCMSSPFQTNCQSIILM